PHLSEARDAATRIIRLQRDLILLRTEMSATRNAKRGALLGGALFFAALSFTFLIFWITVGFHDRGWSPFWIALGSAIVLAVPAAGFALWSAKVGPRPPEASR
ncbi:MAG: phage holin family protein, partial [Bdellovibrionota bacterium]